MSLPIGPLALRDMNGSDVGLAVARFNFQEYGDRFLPAPILEEMVKLNLLGQKTREGFYKYDENTRKRSGPNSRLAEILVKVGGIREDWTAIQCRAIILAYDQRSFSCFAGKSLRRARSRPGHDGWFGNETWTIGAGERNWIS